MRLQWLDYPWLTEYHKKQVSNEGDCNQTANGDAQNHGKPCRKSTEELWRRQREDYGQIGAYDEANGQGSRNASGEATFSQHEDYHGSD